MATTISIDSALEARLKDRASKEGKDLDTVVEGLLSAALDWEAEDRAEAIAGIQRGLEAGAAGRVRPAADVFTDLKARLAQINP